MLSHYTTFMLIALTASCLCMDKKYLQNSWNIKHNNEKPVESIYIHEKIYIITEDNKKNEHHSLYAFNLFSGNKRRIDENCISIYCPDLERNNDGSILRLHTSRDDIVYNLKNNTSKKLTEDVDWFLLNTAQLVGIPHNSTKVITYNIANNTTSTKDFGNIITDYYKSYDKFIIIVNKQRLYYYDPTTEECSIITNKVSRSCLSTLLWPLHFLLDYLTDYEKLKGSTIHKEIFAYYDDSITSIVVYNLITKELAKKLLKDYIMHLSIIHNTIVYTQDSQDAQEYTLWNFKTDVTDTISLPTRSFLHDTSNLFAVFSSLKDGTSMYIYNFETKKLFTVKENIGDICLNDNNSFAIRYQNRPFYQDNTTITLYETSSWKPIITKELDQPCVEHIFFEHYCVIIPHNYDHTKTYFIMYDLHDKSILFKSELYPHYRYLKHYKNYLIFPLNEQTICIYNYLNDKKNYLKLKGVMASMHLEDDILSIHAGDETTVFDLSETTLERNNMYNFNSNFDCNITYNF